MEVLCFIAATIAASIAWAVAYDRNSKREAETAKGERALEELRIAADERKHAHTVADETKKALAALTQEIDARIGEVQREVSKINMREARSGFGGR